MKSIRNLKNLKGKTVLLRADLNVPIKDGIILDDFKIKSSLATIKLLQKKKAKTIIVSHLSDQKESLSPVIEVFKKYFKKDVVLLENIRKQKGEEENDPEFAKKLSKLGDLYINDAFAVSHRRHASLVGVPKYLPSYAGLQLEAEVKNLSKVFKRPKHPFLFILGGAKLEIKIPLLKHYLKIADFVFIGGVLLNTFLKAQGYEVGKSLVGDSKKLKNITNNSKIILPLEVLVLSKNKFINKKIIEIEKEDIIIDISENSIEMIKKYIEKSKLILWNGPLGKYKEGGDKGTKKLLKILSLSKAETILGGGDLHYLITETKMENKFSFISTGGGATLEFLNKGTLPAIKALK